MKYLVDKALSTKSVSFLNENGFEAIRVNKAISEDHVKDETIFSFAIEKNYVIITMDLESRLHETIEQPDDLIPEVDDEEWVNLTKEEKDDFLDHLSKGNAYETESFTIERLEKRREKAKSKNAQE